MPITNNTTNKTATIHTTDSPAPRRVLTMPSLFIRRVSSTIYRTIPNLGQFEPVRSSVVVSKGQASPDPFLWSGSVETWTTDGFRSPFQPPPPLLQLRGWRWGSGMRKSYVLVASWQQVHCWHHVTSCHFEWRGACAHIFWYTVYWNGGLNSYFMPCYFGIQLFTRSYTTLFSLGHRNLHLAGG